mgnify:CR=1 FL=1
MLDIRYIKEKPDEVIARLAKKGKDAKEEIGQILELDAKRRDLIRATEDIKAEQNRTNKLIPQYKKEGKDVSAIFAQMKELSAKTKEIDEKLKEVEEEANQMLDNLMKSYLKKHPPKDRRSTMEMWKLREQAKQLAEEVIYGEIVYKYH